MKNVFQIDIPKRSQLCSIGNELLSEGMEYYSLLTTDAEGAYSRRDLCPICWDKFQENFSGSENKTHWRSKVPSKKAIAVLPVNRDDRVLYLLKEVLNDPENQGSEAFVLALYLARRRVLLLRHELCQEDGSVLLLYEVGATEEMLCVKKMQLSSLQTEKIQLEIASKLKALIIQCF